MDKYTDKELKELETELFLKLSNTFDHDQRKLIFDYRNVAIKNVCNSLEKSHKIEKKKLEEETYTEAFRIGYVKGFSNGHQSFVSTPTNRF